MTAADPGPRAHRVTQAPPSVTVRAVSTSGRPGGNVRPPPGVDIDVAPLLVLAVLVGGSLLELYVIITVGALIGALPTVALLLATSLAGAWLLRREGGRAWAAFTDAVAARRSPHREVADGALVLVGGTLMLVPGFVSDVLGLACLLPPTRVLARRFLLGTAARRAAVRVRSYRMTATDEPPFHPHPGAGRVIDGELDPGHAGTDPSGDPR